MSIVAKQLLDSYPRSRPRVASVHGKLFDGPASTRRQANPPQRFGGVTARLVPRRRHRKKQVAVVAAAVAAVEAAAVVVVPPPVEVEAKADADVERELAELIDGMDTEIVGLYADEEDLETDNDFEEFELPAPNANPTATDTVHLLDCATAQRATSTAIPSGTIMAPVRRVKFTTTTTPSTPPTAAVRVQLGSLFDRLAVRFDHRSVSVFVGADAVEAIAKEAAAAPKTPPMGSKRGSKRSAGGVRSSWTPTKRTKRLKKSAAS